MIRTVAHIVKGEAAALHAVRMLVLDSKWFELTPLPDDEWEIQVKQGERIKGSVFGFDESLRVAAVHVALVQHGTDECEIDDHAAVSESDDGAWVQAWVWVQAELLPKAFHDRFESTKTGE